MNEKLMKVILTGQNEEIIPLTADEIALLEESKKATEAEKIAAELKAAKIAADKEALLDKLGITADEAKLLLS